MLSAEGLATADSATIETRGVGGGPVPVEEIVSLLVEIDEITLQRCGPDEDGGGELETVLMTDTESHPTVVTITEGGMVRFEWTSDAPHTVTSGKIGLAGAGSEFDESRDAAGAAVELIFEDAGVYPYFSDTSEDVAQGMGGVVNVVRGGVGGPDDGGFVSIPLDEPITVDIIDLTVLSQELSDADIPPGEYCRIIIGIQVVELVLAGDPDDIVIDGADVHVTANGRLFLDAPFTIEEGDDVLIVLNFESIHLVLAGASGMYVLTPHIGVVVTFADAAANFDGIIVPAPEAFARGVGGEPVVLGSVWVQKLVDDDEDPGTPPVEEGEPVEVVVFDTTIIETDDDSDDPTDGVFVALGFADLALEVGEVEGLRVHVEGRNNVDSTVDADLIVVHDDDFDTQAA
jgi:plastocyanin